MTWYNLSTSTLIHDSSIEIRIACSLVSGQNTAYNRRLAPLRLKEGFIT
jgi:hypothetical protein